MRHLSNVQRNDYQFLLNTFDDRFIIPFNSSSVLQQTHTHIFFSIRSISSDFPETNLIQFGFSHFSRFLSLVEFYTRYRSVSSPYLRVLQNIAKDLKIKRLMTERKQLLLTGGYADDAVR